MLISVKILVQVFFIRIVISKLSVKAAFMLYEESFLIFYWPIISFMSHSVALFTTEQNVMFTVEWEILLMKLSTSMEWCSSPLLEILVPLWAQPVLLHLPSILPLVSCFNTFFDWIAFILSLVSLKANILQICTYAVPFWVQLLDTLLVNV